MVIFRRTTPLRMSSVTTQDASFPLQGWVVNDVEAVDSAPGADNDQSCAPVLPIVSIVTVADFTAPICKTLNLATPCLVELRYGQGLQRVGVDDNEPG
jgi:hypothetical protein